MYGCLTKLVLPKWLGYGPYALTEKCAASFGTNGRSVGNGGTFNVNRRVLYGGQTKLLGRSNSSCLIAMYVLAEKRAGSCGTNGRIAGNGGTSSWGFNRGVSAAA